MCGTLVILSDLCEVRLSLPFSQLPLLQLVEFSDGIMLENAQRDDVRKSFEFTLNHVGQDKDSGEIGVITSSFSSQE